MEHLKLVLENLDLLLALAGSIVCAASLFVAGTPTPDPESTLGRIYKIIESAALMFGRAKETGQSTRKEHDAEGNDCSGQGGSACGK